MKIRNPALIRWIGFVGALLIKVWVSTLSFRYRSLGQNVFPDRGFERFYIYAFWHENMLVPCQEFARNDALVLISHHADGELIAQVCKNLGWGIIRGSTTRGGLTAMRGMMRATTDCHLVISPDGPRGPRRCVGFGLIYLAAKTGIPIVLLGVGHDRPWRLKTWDHFVIPRPFSNAVVLGSEPIFLPESATKDELETYRLQVEKALTELTDLAERLATARA